MPKIVELTVEVNVQKVSCPGVWLCQDGRVSLSIFALGSTYQTCLLPPVFPLLFKDVFYFRKRFQETCAVNNMCCLLKDESIYCELVQWCADCTVDECVMLAQYLGPLNEVLFPPNICSSEGVDLLMRRSAAFPGILSPKIEISTKVRIDEILEQRQNEGSIKVKSCNCSPKDLEPARQKQVCHSSQYHRSRCNSSRSPSTSRSKSRMRSMEHKSCCNLTQKPPAVQPTCCRKFTQEPDSTEKCGTLQRISLESNYIPLDKLEHSFKTYAKPRFVPCVCDICRRYHELFHTSNMCCNLTK